MRNCNCSNTIRQNKDEIRKRAIKFSETMEVDVQIHTWTQSGFGRLWDFEEAGTIDRGRGVIEVIKFRKHKSKDVLQDTEHDKPITGNTRGGDTKKRRKPQQKVSGGDEPTRKRKPKRSAKSVESDSGEVL